MKIVSLNCVQCSAPLEVAADTQLMRCSFCHTALAIRCDDEDGHAYSEIVAEPPEEVDAASSERPAGEDEAGDDEALDRDEMLELFERTPQQQLEQLDQQRAQQERRTPTRKGSLFAAILITAVGICWAVSSTMEINGSEALLEKSPGRALFGFALIVTGLIGGSVGVGMRREFERSEVEYLDLRRALQQQIAEDEADTDAGGE